MVFFPHWDLQIVSNFKRGVKWGVSNLGWTSVIHKNIYFVKQNVLTSSGCVSMPTIRGDMVFCGIEEQWEPRVTSKAAFIVPFLAWDIACTRYKGDKHDAHILSLEAEAQRATEDAIKRELKYQKDKEVGSFLYFFKFRQEKYCIDATGTSVLMLKEVFFT